MARTKPSAGGLPRTTNPKTQAYQDTMQDDFNQDDSTQFPDLADELDQSQTGSDSGTEEEPSMGQLMEAYRSTRLDVVQLSQQIERLRNLMEHQGDVRNMAGRASDAHAYLAQMRAAFQQDPVLTVQHMIDQAFHGIATAAEQKAVGLLATHRLLKKKVAEVAEDPKYPNLKDHLDALKDLVFEKGMHPDLAAQTLADVVNNTRNRNRTISDMSEQIRNRSALEENSDSSYSPDKVREFDKRLKSAKNLTDMFDVVRNFRF